MGVLPEDHLPRLGPENYRGRTFVHWTFNFKNRSSGWLTPAFHVTWQRLLVHTCARYALACPCYVLMPDHIHLLWVGLHETVSDQRIALEFLRKHLRPTIAPHEWQRQAYDHVLRVHEYEKNAFAAVAYYILENPCRAELVTEACRYSYSGCCIPGYPDLDLWDQNYWDLFWRIYGRFVDSR